MSNAAKLSTVPHDPNIPQRAASDPGASVWVNASAGSGKTKVLTERVTRLLLSGVRPEKILCLTYTRAGAAEMANRVTDTLSKWAVCDDDTLRRDLDKLQNTSPHPQQLTEARRLFARVLSCPGGLRIRTIHSFCQEILSRFPIEAGLPPHFSLIDEQELEVLHNNILDDLLREAADHPNGELAQALSVLIATRGESSFEDTLHEVTHMRSRLTQALETAGGEQNLIAQTRRLLQLEPDDTSENIRESAMKNIPEQDLRQLSIWLAQGSKTHQERGATLADILSLSRDQRAESFDSYKSIFLTLENTSRKAFANKEILRQHPEIDDISGREALRLQSALERIEAAEIAATTASVVIFGSAFIERLAARKAARAALDYDDLIRFTENLLHQQGIAPWILYKLDQGLDHVLVDEAQDTSRAQWNIVQSLTQEFYAGQGARNFTRTLFVVGDEKQSIFSFQNADPEAFLSLRDFFTKRLAVAGGELKRIPLHTSFRSAPAILQAVDAVFADSAARAGVSEEAVTHVPFHKPGEEKYGRVETWPLLTTPDTQTANDGAWLVPTVTEAEQDPQAELAQNVARKIKFWLTHKEILPGFARPIAAGDIMILLRRRGRFADLMVRALKAHQVAVTGVDRMHLIDQLPVMDLLAMLRFVLLPEDDLNLACLLRGPLLGLSEEQLMQLAIGREGSLWQSLQAAPAFTAIRDYLSAKLNEADFSTPFAFLSHILNAPCPANTDSGRKALWTRLGEEAQDPVDELLNEAQNFTRSHAPSLQNFLHWLTQADAEIKRELDHGGGQVRIMTVHAAKGLEAPIVFLPDTASVPRSADMPKFQWSHDAGPGDIPLFLTRMPQWGVAQNIGQQAREKQMQEYRRLFYVALTRASHRLYICGWQSGKSETALDQSWYALAANALRPLHQDHVAADAIGPTPDIVFADVALKSAVEPKNTTSLILPKELLPDWASRPGDKNKALPLDGGGLGGVMPPQEIKRR